MKKNILALIILTLLSLNISCKAQEQVQLITSKELPVESLNDTEWHFTMYHSIEHIDWPIVHLEIGNSAYYFLVDTGALYNYFFGIPNGSMKITKGEHINTFTINSKIKNRETRVCFYDQFKSEINSKYKTLGIDGIIGCEFLQNYNNVVFDYNNRKIIFDAEPISKQSVPMLSFSVYSHCLEFSVDGKTEYGLIDTGSSMFVIRENFGDGKAFFDRKSLLLANIGKEPIKTRFRNNKIINNIKIVDTDFKEIISFEWDSKFINHLDGVQNLAQNISILGNSFWKNHVIQLDFYHSVFRIK